MPSLPGGGFIVWIDCTAPPSCAGPGGCKAAVWVVLSTLLSDVLLRDQWLAVWDHLVAMPPQHLRAMAAALLVTGRGRLLAARGPKSRLALMRKPNAVDVQQVQTVSSHQHAWMPLMLVILFRTLTGCNRL